MVILTPIKGGFVNIEFLTSLTVASNLWRPAPWYGWVFEAGDDVDILLLAHRHYSFMFNCFFETLVIQLMANAHDKGLYS